MMNEEQCKRLIDSGLTAIQFDVPMSSYCTLRAGGKAAAFIEVANLEELRRLLSLLTQEAINFFVIGHGSNLLVADSGYSGVIIQLQGEFNTIVLHERNKTAAVINVGAGCALAQLVSWCNRHGLAGLEFLVGIPGSVGGAVRMNAGAWGYETGQQLLGIEFIDNQGNIRQISSAELCLSYRNLALADGELNGIITAAWFRLKPDQEEALRSRCATYLERRKGKQPKGVASAGSFFKNPSGDFAGRLIEAAGLKGASCGAAMISPVHANFLVNTGGASATDILSLMAQVQTTVFSQFAIKLEPEVRIIQESYFP